jgi:hypothetical protein
MALANQRQQMSEHSKQNCITVPIAVAPLYFRRRLSAPWNAYCEIM